MNKTERLQILVATHKEYIMPNEKIYLPIHVGKEGKKEIGFIGDNTGENISQKNKNYCELTALYWAWKNLDCEYVGLCHYRRYFSNKGLAASNKQNNDSAFSQILSKENIDELMNNYDVILPKKRNYFIESIWSHYDHAHNITDLEKTKIIFKEYYPEYLDSFNKIMFGKKLHLFNMFLMKKQLFNEYSEWLFDILQKLESEINIENYNPYQARVYGFISERLFNVWLEYQSLKVKELEIVTLEKENKLAKYYKFLNRKIKGNDPIYN
ncbi:DUF4422 domain-containing protein [Metabacillus sp. cB07]|uniref:DUF4422 domain-containing protein n=1 Tax=Metabacillus sp. cB07 TaxID=2806989 RepID=UPI001939B325|nr:DUF4422 domain-containing protein [Metabacillus sp. cB07]